MVTFLNTVCVTL